MKFFLLIAFAFLFLQVKAQKALILRSNLGSSGHSNIIQNENKIIYFQQSIGQTGVIGNYINSGKILKQGFIQPIFLNTNLNRSNPPLIYPNPINDSFHISFEEKIDYEIQISVYSIIGKLLFQKSFKPNQSIRIQLPDIPAGQYLVHTSFKTDFFVSQIIKN